MDKLETLIECLPNAPYKTLFAVEINALRAEIVTLQSDNERLTKELDEAGSNCSMYKQQVLSLTKERDELVKAPATILELCALLEKAEDALEYPFDIVVLNERTVSTKAKEALAAIKQWKEKADAIRGPA